MAEQLASSVSSGLESQIRKVLSVVLLLSLIELVANASAQSNQLNPLSTFWLVLLMAATFATTISSWFTSGKSALFILHGALAGS